MTDASSEVSHITTDASGTPSRTLSRAQVLRWLAGFVAVLLVVEIGGRVVGGRVDAPLEYFSPPAEELVGDMDVLQRNGVISDITFVGTSMVRRGIDAQVVERELGVPYVNNVAVAGSMAENVQRWLLEEVRPRIHPKHVVWGISSLEFNQNSRAGTIAAYRSARATRTGLLGDADRAFADASALARHRKELRDPLALIDGLRGNGTDFSRNRPLDTRAVWKLEYPKRTPAQLAQLRRNHLELTVKASQLYRYELSEAALDAYRTTLAALVADDVGTAVVIMPVTTLYLGAHPNGVRDYDAWRRAVSDIADDVGVTVLDFHDTYPDDQFRDVEHLNIAPAREFSERVAARLRELGWAATKGSN